MPGKKIDIGAGLNSGGEREWRKERKRKSRRGTEIRARGAQMENQGGANNALEI